MGKMKDDNGRASSFRRLPPTFWWLWGGQLVNRMAGFVIPFMALFAADKGLSIALVGTVGAAFGLGCLLATLTGGVLVDIVGRRPVILWSQVLTAAATVLLAVSAHPAVFVTAMFAVGFFSNAVRPAMATVVVDVVPQEKLVQAYSLLHWAYNIGFSVTPLLVAAFATKGMNNLLLADAVTTLLFAVVVYLQVPESRPQPADAVDEPRQSLWHGFGLVLRDRAFLTLNLLILLIAVIMNQYNVTLPLTMAADGLPASSFAYAIAVNGIMVTFLQLPLGRLLPSSQAHATTTAAIGALLYGIGFGSGAFADTVLVYGAAVAVWTVGEMLFAPASAALVAVLSPEHRRGLYQGVNSVAWASSSVLAPGLGVWLLSGQGADTVWIACFVGGIVAAVGLLLLGAQLRRRPSAEPTELTEAALTP